MPRVNLLRRLAGSAADEVKVGGERRRQSRQRRVCLSAHCELHQQQWVEQLQYMHGTRESTAR